MKQGGTLARPRPGDLGAPLEGREPERPCEAPRAAVLQHGWTAAPPRNGRTSGLEATPRERGCSQLSSARCRDPADALPLFERLFQGHFSRRRPRGHSQAPRGSEGWTAIPACTAPARLRTVTRTEIKEQGRGALAFHFKGRLSWSARTLPALTGPSPRDGGDISSLHGSQEVVLETGLTFSEARSYSVTGPGRRGNCRG